MARLCDTTQGQLDKRLDGIIYQTDEVSLLRDSLKIKWIQFLLDLPLQGLFMP
jgi:hypothetical protein